MKKQNYIQQFIKCLEGIDRSRHSYDIFNDFLEVGAISLFNLIAKDENIEKQFQDTIHKYNNPEKFVSDAAELLGITTLALKESPCDFLGEVYSAAKFFDKNKGQIFTPYHISRLMAECTLTDESLKNIIDEQGYITLQEPACGAGGIVIAAADTIKKHGYNPSEVMLFHATDIDIKCCYMTYIQTSLLDLTGVVIHGNTLTLESWKAFVTPMASINHHFLKLYQKCLTPKKTTAEIIPFKKKQTAGAVNNE